MNLQSLTRTDRQTEMNIRSHACYDENKTLIFHPVDSLPYRYTFDINKSYYIIKVVRFFSS